MAATSAFESITASNKLENSEKFDWMFVFYSLGNPAEKYIHIVPESTLADAIADLLASPTASGHDFDLS